MGSSPSPVQTGHGHKSKAFFVDNDKARFYEGNLIFLNLNLKTETLTLIKVKRDGCTLLTNIHKKDIHKDIRDFFFQFFKSPKNVFCLVAFLVLQRWRKMSQSEFSEGRDQVNINCTLCS